jgi:hypothetical protein
MTRVKQLRTHAVKPPILSYLCVLPTLSYPARKSVLSLHKLVKQRVKGIEPSCPTRLGSKTFLLSYSESLRMLLKWAEVLTMF